MVSIIYVCILMNDILMMDIHLERFFFLWNKIKNTYIVCIIYSIFGMVDGKTQF